MNTKITIFFIISLLFCNTIVKAQDSTSSSVSIGIQSAHNWILHPIPINFEFKELTSSVEFYFNFDRNKFFFSGVTTETKDDNLKEVSYKASSLDSIKIVIAWTVPTLKVDSIATIWMTPKEQGVGTIKLHNFLFNERGNDDVSDLIVTFNVQSFSSHPLIDPTQNGLFIDVNTVETNYILRDSVYSVIHDHYLLRSDVGDPSCNGTITAFDASIIMQLSVGLMPVVAAHNPDLCPTPILNSLLPK